MLRALREELYIRLEALRVDLTKDKGDAGTEAGVEV